MESKQEAPLPNITRYISRAMIAQLLQNCSSTCHIYIIFVMMIM